VANFNGNTLSVLLGDGTFQGATKLPGGFGNDNAVSVLLGSLTGAPFHLPFFSGEASLSGGAFGGQ
jgi:hypothetical protein